MSVLVTGATGHVGQALLPLLDEPVVALVRAKDDAHLAARRADLLSKLPPGYPADRLQLVRGDVTEPGLGLSERDRDRVLAEVDSLVHSAASVRFDLPEDVAARENVAATDAMLDLARALADRGRLRRLDHVSTAYVAGDRRGRVYERELNEGQGFRNTYEASKCLAEGHVRAAMAAGLPAAVHRPSIVVGDSRTGLTRSFNVIYWPLRVWAGGWWSLFPGRRDALVDIVPVDWVASAIARLRAEPGTLGATFHLASGDEAVTVERIEAELRRVVGGPKLRYVDQGTYTKWVRPVLMGPLQLTRQGRAIARGGRAFLPYFVGNPLFDNSALRAALGEGPPPVMDYFARIVNYAVERGFRAES